jgi:hypothetical protein
MEVPVMLGGVGDFLPVQDGEGIHVGPESHQGAFGPAKVADDSGPGDPGLDAGKAQVPEDLRHPLRCPFLPESRFRKGVEFAPPPGELSG